MQVKKKPKPGPGRLSAEDTAELPTRLMDAALALFTERGFSGTTMDDIAKQAGASTKTLYSRYANKAEILQAVVERNLELTVKQHLRTFALTPENSDPRDYLYKFGLQIALAVADPGSGMQRVTIAEAHRITALRMSYRSVIGLGVDALARALRVWRDMGLVTFEEESQLVGAVCFAALTDTPRIRAVIGAPMPRHEAERYVATAADLLMCGLSAANPAKKKSGQSKS